MHPWSLSLSKTTVCVYDETEVCYLLRRTLLESHLQVVVVVVEVASLQKLTETLTSTTSTSITL